MADEESGIPRKVYFLRVEHFAQLQSELPGAFQRISNLPFNDTGRYQIDALTNSRLCGFPGSQEYPLRFKFGRTRRDLLPEVEREGHLKTLELQEDEGLIDVCHIIIFSDGYVAAEYNRDGPRIEKLGAYLFEKGAALSALPRFLPLYERDIVEVVSHLDQVRVLDIEVPPDSIALLREADDNVASAVEASAKAGATKRVGLTLTAEPGSTLLKGLAGRLAAFVKSRPTDRNRFKSLRAVGYSDGSSLSRYVDILEEKLVSGEIFPRTSPRSRSIDSERAYQLIHQAYNERREKLEAAATGNDPW